MPKKKKSFFEDLRDEVMEETCDYVKEKVTRKVIRIGEMSAAFLFAFVLIVIGLAELMASLVPVLDRGLNFLVLGVLFLVIGFLLK